MTSRTGLFIALAMGVITGLFCYLVVESKAPSYLSTNSKSCANCHVMLSSYNTWSKSSHRRSAECVDCHIPHENLIRKYAAKAMDGGRHAYVFTTGTYPEVIRTTETAKSTIQRNCIRCHEDLLVGGPAHNSKLLANHSINRPCWSCHREVPHGRSNSISAFIGVATGDEKAASFIQKEKKP